MNSNPAADADRFAAQASLPGLGRDGVARIRAARVHVVGAGAAAGPALLFLAQAGVGTLYLDDGADVNVADVRAWLYAPDQIGEQRLFPALEAVRAVSSLVRVRAFSSDALSTAALVCPESDLVARKAAEQARVAGVPHVVALGNGVVTVPPGAPCYRCASKTAKRVGSTRTSPAAVGALAATELLLMIGHVTTGSEGRRLDVADGWPTAQPTARIPGCDCLNVY